MKKHITFGAIIALIFAASFTLAEEATVIKKETTTVTKTTEAKVPPTTLQLHQSKEGNFTVQLPADWEVRTGFMGTDVLALAPYQKNPEQFRENVSVLVVKLDQPLPAKEYYDLNLQGLQKLLTNYKLEQSEAVTIDGVDALKLVYTHQMGEIKAKVTQFLLLKDNKAYVITFSAEPDNFNKLLPQIDEVIKSFHFDKK